MARTTKGSGVWNQNEPDPKHGDYRPGSFKVLGQVGKAMWQIERQRWCASCKGWKPVAGVTGNLACPDCKATWVNPESGKRRPEPEPKACDEHCACPLCQPYIPEN
jgi:hypothetical protein